MAKKSSSIITLIRTRHLIIKKHTNLNKLILKSKLVQKAIVSQHTLSWTSYEKDTKIKIFLKH